MMPTAVVPVRTRHSPLCRFFSPKYGYRKPTSICRNIDPKIRNSAGISKKVYPALGVNMRMRIAHYTHFMTLNTFHNIIHINVMTLYTHFMTLYTFHQKIYDILVPFLPTKHDWIAAPAGHFLCVDFPHQNMDQNTHQLDQHTANIFFPFCRPKYRGKKKCST